MSMNKSIEPAVVEGGPAGTPDGTEPRRAAVIDVSYADDGGVIAGLPLVIVYPGDEIILLAPAGETRAFNVRLAEDFPLDRGAGDGPAVYVTGSQTSGSEAMATASTALGGRILRSGPLQAVRLRIAAEATPGHYDYGLEADASKPVAGVVFAGGVIIRPTPPPGPRP